MNVQCSGLELNEHKSTDRPTEQPTDRSKMFAGSEQALLESHVSRREKFIKNWEERSQSVRFRFQEEKRLRILLKKKSKTETDEDCASHNDKHIVRLFAQRANKKQNCTADEK